MAILYVKEPGLQVHKQGQRLLVKRNDEILEDIPLIKVERVVLMGRGVSITTPALYALAQQKIDLLYLNSRGGYVSRLVGREHKHSRLRQTQAVSVTDGNKTLQIARAIVEGKINNQRVLVQRHAEGAAWASRALERMNQMRRQVSEARTMDELRGREGMAAKDYFDLLRRLLKPPADGKSWGFDRRAYYPPTDPVNALLSFGYTLLLQDLIAACQIAGLDPDLGYFHAVDHGKPAMALDLEEEFRPVIVDSLVLLAINRPYFSLHDFEVGQPRRGTEPEPDAPAQTTGARQTPPIFMKEAARKRYIELYETRLSEQIYYSPKSGRFTYRKIFELQAYQMAQVILGEVSSYAPFLVR